MPRTTNISGKPPVGVLIGTRLKELGKEQKWLAAKSHLSQQYLSAIIAGRAIPSLKLLHAIAKNLGITVGELSNALLGDG